MTRRTDQDLDQMEGWDLYEALLSPWVTPEIGAPHLDRLEGRDLSLTLRYCPWITAEIGTLHLDRLKGRDLSRALLSPWTTAEIGTPHLDRLEGWGLSRALRYCPWITAEIREKFAD